ncbi:exodeoxyribonuclease V subunit alpha [Gordonia soli]|uniref:RecBCD enzyme subunit RecD n=1 Tax=Gordonia soli NBRC 108243 TaxID=1223545 RepID=M0QN01_9ACTN|nr:exodeoxyribonuclease V subunit alpha [Gordonia soli]GAC69666.1 exodeoxyribonuclease V alpha chain [Gordonia soli NBRC 108243]
MTDPGTVDEVTTRRERHSGQLVESGAGTLRVLNELGVLAAADLHVTRRLMRMSGAGSGASGPGDAGAGSGASGPGDAGAGGEVAALATALTVRAVRLGSTCLTLDRYRDVIPLDDEVLRAEGVTLPSPAELVRAVVGSPLVAGGTAGPLRPLVVMDSDDGPLLYLQKYFRQEDTIRDLLDRRSGSRPTVDAVALAEAVDAVFGDAPPGGRTDRQRVAAALAATSWTTVLAGGPGTGKTHTVSRILAVLHRLSGGASRMGLCAPTGRAAAQLQSEVSADELAPAGLRAVTVHSLLGWRPGSVPRHGPSDKLPFDVIVVDETSMLSITAMSALLSAVRADARVILVGDPHQLASVEAGAVLADLVDRESSGSGNPVFDEVVAPAAQDFSGAEIDRLRSGVITLRHGFRFGGRIAEVAEAVNRGDAERVVELVSAGDDDAVTLLSADDVDDLRPVIATWGHALYRSGIAGDQKGALAALESHRVLCAHRDGVWGVSGWSQRIREWLTADGGIPSGMLDPAAWYPGRPVLVTATDRQAGVFNGDSGVAVAADPGDRHGPVDVLFRRGDEIRTLHPTRLADVVSVYAMTIHRSQGSQFDEVTVVLPPTGSELLTRELLYTAVTRARRAVRIIGDVEVLRAAVSLPVQRASGLRSAVRPHRSGA